MSGIAASVRQAGPATEGQLGKLIARCRPRRRINVWLESGTPPIPILLGPLLAATVLTMIPLVAARKYLDAPAPFKDPVMAGATMFWFVLCLLLVINYCFSAPRSSSFLVYEKGFRFRGRVVKFSDLAYVHVGLPSSGLRQAVSGMAECIAPFSRHARAGLHVQRVTENISLTLGFKDGAPWCMKGVLAAYEDEDLQRFFQVIGSKRPDLIREDGGSEADFRPRAS